MNEDEKEVRRKAVALRYDPAKDSAPRVVAKGAGLLAGRILELAREHGLRVHEDPALVEVLAKLDLNVEIPEDLYQAIAEIFAFIYRLDQRKAEWAASSR